MKRCAYWLLTLLVLAGCAGKKMDLAPLTEPGGTGVSAMCSLQQGRLLVAIVNRGRDHSLSSTTIVRFDDGPEKVLPTQPVPPQGKVEVSTPLPQECLDEDGCSFTVTADGRFDIPETDESNNTYRGSCRP
ncbi:MAG TPA: CARDB domain-containing protein [Acidobacteriota bacterium]|nr:CARDB domain-containing protein [Acidobacteriota bacterium]